ncbi:phospholipase D-like domain-containing protein, partial [Candidatus Pelagadaptatus aseana]|uniref:phospholipase D-like domain-containing protein n=1 Tax=Candidatus Pelagadaptatus aseana TaxID=3120508 RepID=UPI003C6EC978
MTSLQGRCRKGLLAVIFFAISAVCLAADSELSPSPFDRLTHQFEEKAGVHLLEYGEDALMARAWLTSQSTKSIDVQYFIWSTDNIGILAGEALLSAADRGVQVRVLVDDLLIDAENKTILVLDAHPNVQIKIYNPNYNVGTNAAGRMFNILKDFRGINQRMHDKVAIFDGVVGITGGRNMADEYFDYDHHYNFRDRDALVVGSPVAAMSENFNEFWGSEFAMPVSDIFADMEISTKDVESHYHALRAYSSDPENFEPEIRAIIDGYDEAFAETLRKITVADIEFISDHPGKNNFSTLGGGSITSDRLLADILAAKESILIQSPYLILSDDLIEVLAGLIHKGVSVTISTNSLAS